MTNKIVEEFIEATPHWHDALIEKEKPCIMCGIIPNNLRDLATTLTTLRADHEKELEEVKTQMKLELLQVFNDYEVPLTMTAEQVRDLIQKTITPHHTYRGEVTRR